MALGSVPRKRLRVSTPPAAAAPAAALVAAAPRQPRKNTLQHAGLRNLGNTCYLNAVLQVLLRCPRLQELLRQQATASSSADTLLSDLSSTLELMATQQSSHSPSSLLERLRMQHHVFRGGGQHDAQELLRCLLLSVHEAWAIQQPESCSEHGPRAAEHVGEHVGGRVGPSAAEQVFHGELEYTTRCLQCDERRTTREGFSDLSLSVHHEQPLEWGLAQFFEAERLRGGEKYFCASCRACTEAVRTPRVRHAPPVISLHLKRFACDAGEAEARRVAQHVQLPPSLSLASYATPCCEQRDATYTLFGLVAHSGRSGCGHYTSYVQPCAAASQLDAALGASLPDGGFLCFDDEECVALSAADLAAAFSPASRSAALACLCFYRLREPGE